MATWSEKVLRWAHALQNGPPADITALPARDKYLADARKGRFGALRARGFALRLRRAWGTSRTH
jgi:hypothetical protein